MLILSINLTYYAHFEYNVKQFLIGCRFLINLVIKSTLKISKIFFKMMIFQ
ncbi:hypothetical protein E9S_05822 [Moraxella catarrhalis BC7]|nr:hypothetical protein E9U_04048 [Moraxella catarrhalis BC8]EGE21231.1 hypothetical protein E9S_05822 [Moraxella catarrhalis BC7]